MRPEAWLLVGVVVALGLPWTPPTRVPAPPAAMVVAGRWPVARLGSGLRDRRDRRLRRDRLPLVLELVARDLRSGTTLNAALTRVARADGTGLAGDPVELIRNDLSWERDVVEGPSMIEVDGVWHLFYSANRWDTADYAVGHAVCETVTGPCVKDPEPWLASTDGTAGPGGLEVIELADRPNDLVVYHGWTGGEVGYPDGARALYARLIRWVDGQPVLVGR